MGCSLLCFYVVLFYCVNPNVSLSLRGWKPFKRRPPVCEGFCRFAIHTQAWSSPREEGLHYNWDEPRDPAASLADPTLGRAWKRAAKKRAMAAITIHGEKFTGNPRDWKDAKTEIVTAIANAGCTFVMDAGTTLFQLAGSGDHSAVEDDEIVKHFEEKEWTTQLLSIRSQITKTTLDTKCEEYQALSDQKKTKLRNWKIVEWFRQANTRVIKALRDHLLPKKAEKGGPRPRSCGNSS